ncbi:MULTISPECIES: hypothetical protein [Stenotrophomonas]|uniref:hypothetical protein n=1 Tax=Stenotrophomonas TaxID=40323 RepID=UPI002158F9B7|nr:MULTISPECIES: hypothetical protein [Stenotrophomonas]
MAAAVPPHSDLTGSLHVTQGAPPPSSSTRAVPPPNSPDITAAAWNRRPRNGRALGLEHWPRWLRAIPDVERAGALMRLFGALFLLLPGIALVASTYRHASAAAAAAVFLFVTVHAALHGLATWRAATTHSIPPIVRFLDGHAAGIMIASSLLIAIGAGMAKLPVSPFFWLLAGTVSQLFGARMAGQRLRNALLVLGSALQFIAMALLALLAAG